MKRGLVVLALAALVGATACKTRRLSTAEVLSLETSSALEIACRQQYSGAEREDAVAARGQLCACLAKAPASRLKDGAGAHCAPGATLDKWERSIVGKTKSQWPVDFVAGGVDNVECLEGFTQRNVETFYYKITSACQDDEGSLDELLAYPSDSSKSCWLFPGMTADGCIEAIPCAATANLKDLPLARPENREVSGKVEICNAQLRKIHDHKDPNNANLAYNRAFVIDLAHGLSYERVPYGTSNCHGTAQAVQGDFLTNELLTGYGFQRLADRERCEDKAKALLASVEKPTPKKLALDPGGVIINMRYGACDASDCGTVELAVDSCTDGDLKAYTFIQGMCVDCWGKKLEANGYPAMSAQSSWQDLTPGCVLTQNDHSISMIAQSDGYCYYYEATTPFGPPQLRAVPCPAVWSSFPKRWCPNRPMTFEARR